MKERSDQEKKASGGFPRDHVLPDSSEMLSQLPILLHLPWMWQNGLASTRDGRP